MMKKIALFIVFLLFLLPILVSAVPEPEFVFKQNEESDIKVPCFDSINNHCPVTTACEITILYPNQSVLIVNQSMTYGYDYFNYTLNSTQTNMIGEHTITAFCSGSSNGYSTFSYLITKTGEGIDNVSRIAIIVFFAILIAFCVFMIYYLDGSAKVIPVISALLLITFGFNLLANLAESSSVASPVVSLLWFGYRMSLIVFFASIFFILVILISHLKIRKIRTPQFKTPMQQAKEDRKRRRGIMR